MFKRRLAPRRGNVCAFVAVSLIPMLAVVAIVADGGMLLSDRRQAQRAADSAALAAAVDLFTNWNKNDGTDPSGTAQKSALTTAAANGFSNDGVHSTVTVHIPPQSGTFVAQPGYAEVLITYYQARIFSNIWGSFLDPHRAGTSAHRPISAEDFSTVPFSRSASSQSRLHFAETTDKPLITNTKASARAIISFSCLW
jgi:uncharacterized membrane protein